MSLRPRACAIVTFLILSLFAACTSSPQSGVSRDSQLSGAVEVSLVTAIDTPTAFAVRLGDPTELFYVASQDGGIYRVNSSTGSSSEVLSLRDRTEAKGERGLLGLAFSPDGNDMYVHFSDLNGDTNVSALSVVQGSPDISTIRRLLFVKQPYANHNGGQLVVDRNGNLLIGLGDGGSSGDPLGNAQDPQSLLGKILRIAPTPAGSPSPYLIPVDNPFANAAGVAPEILFLGLRNPWRFSLDQQTGDFWIADVGQNSKEEVNRAGANDLGANFGWNIKEGSSPFKGTAQSELTDPIYEWNNLGGSSAIGGFVYRGPKIKELKGRFLFADFASEGIFALDPVTGEVDQIDIPVSAVVGFGEDAAGEPFVLSLTMGVFALSSAV